VDPSGEHAWRWWSGQTWTTYTASLPGYVAPAVRFAQLESEMRIARLASWAPVVWVVASLVGIIAEWQLGGLMSGDLHWFRHIFDLSRAGSGTTSFGSMPDPPSLAAEGWFWLESPIAIASEVVLVMWQYRASKVAVNLGYPAQVSSGWGVAGWFIPIVQLFLPYLAVRGLLPEGHRTRRILPYWWTSLIVSTVLLGALPFLVVFARPVGVVDVVLSVLLDVAVAALARSIVVAVVADHRAASAALPLAGGTSFQTGSRGGD
jgi:hypothetical protein